MKRCAVTDIIKRWCNVVDVIQICKLQTRKFVILVKVAVIRKVNKSWWASMFFPRSGFCLQHGSRYWRAKTLTVFYFSCNNLKYVISAYKIKRLSLQCYSFEPRSEKTGLRGFRPGPTPTGLYSNRRWLEA